MKPFLYVFAALGAAVLILNLAAAFGIGYFSFYYGAKPVWQTVNCTRPAQ